MYNKYIAYNNKAGSIVVRDQYWKKISCVKKDGAEIKKIYDTTDNVRARIKWLEIETDLLKQYSRVQYEIEYMTMEEYRIIANKKRKENVKKDNT